jgi:gliding motility-associated-like protein
VTLIFSLKKQSKVLFLIIALCAIFSSGFTQVNLTNGLVAYYPFNGNANDASGNNHTGQLINGPTLTTDRFGNANSAYSFDGIDDYIKVLDNGAFSTGNFTLALWFQTETDALQNLVGKRDFTGGNNGAQYQFFINYSPFPGIGSNIVGNTSSCSSISSSSYINTGDVICRSKWYFAVVVFETNPAGTRHKIYIDGVLKKDVAASFSGMLTTCQSDLRFGNWWSGDLIPYKGKMDDIRWYNRAINQAEVTALYDNFPTSSSADFSYSQAPCTPKTIQFNNLTSNTSTITWNFGNNTTNTGNQNPTVTYSSYGTYAVKMKVQTSSGCVDSVTKIIPVNVVQDSLITMADTTICRGNSVQLKTASSLNFCWNTTTGLNNTNISNPIATPVNTTTYYFTSQSIGNNLVVNGDFSAGNTGFQSDYTSQFPNTTEGAYWVGTNSFAWNAGLNACNEHTAVSGNMMLVNGSPVSGAKIWSQTITIVPNTNYAFSVWVQSLAALNPANLKFSINGTLLGNNINAGNIACQWSQFFATWNSGTNTNAVITIVNNNTIAVGNDFALDDISFAPVLIKQDSLKITVTDPPLLTITPNNSICPADTLPLNTTGASVYSWSPSNNLSNANIQNPLAFPTVTTKYIVSAYDLPGCVAKDSVTITVKPKPAITKSNDTAFCVGSTPVTIFASSPGATQYSWSPVNGLSDPAISNPVANPASTNTYHVQITGANGCKAVDSVKVSVLAVPTVDTRSDTTICNNSSTTLFTASTGAASFTWSPATGLSNPKIANPFASPTTTTKYIISVSNGSCSAKDSVTISVIQAPTLSKGNDTTICNQGQAQLFASGATSYLWSPATGLNNPNISNPIASPNAATKYYVAAKGANGCSKIDSVKVDWIPKPVFSITPPAVSICLGDATTITAAGADVYNWYSGSNIQSPSAASTSVLPVTSQQYNVAVRHNFCKLVDTLHSIVTVNSLPITTVSKSNDIDCSNASATLSASGGVSYSWTPLQGTVGANTANPTVNPPTTTTYIVKVTNSNGCSKYDSIKVIAVFNPLSGGYNMPDAFTPNGDGKNDCFGIKYWGAIEKIDFSIYNRWGERVFHSSDPSACWDGNFKGIPQASGTFVYQVIAKTACGEVYKKGTIILMR